ncbi:hypothetical protein AcW1_007429 [Taiwanofungus camphoratus]|nr:hypothetical protein AcW2_007511 [Antrodia cinnamomea]KAI0953119.1 hypothetical protein AcW1_007429 [Antrodia cinnamomea]
MPPKRKGDDYTDTNEPTARERKKQKTAIARTIAVQPTSSTAAVSGNAVAGPSRSVRFDGMQGLPSSLDVERFAEARAYEMNAMHDAMQNASSNATQRAWQQLPRHLRRRAASHDVRRVPLRLRDKAQAEMDPMRRKALGRSIPKRGKAKRVSRTQELLKRQRDKTWLETHLWHAKRMKMENMWGYRLAVQPTEKAYRPSHRASMHGSILHDASYFAFLEINGPEDVLRAIMDSCCDFQGPSPSAKRFLTGARACETHIYKYESYPYDLIAPITIIWRPIPSAAEVDPGAAPVRSAAQASTTSKRKRKGKGKGKEPERAIGSMPQSAPNAGTFRTIWIRVHPLVVTEVHQTLQTAASFALEAFRKSTPGDKVAEVELVDLREHFNVFEIMGPKSTQVIKGVLKPARDDMQATNPTKCKEFLNFWNSLDRLQTTGSLPRGMVIGFTVHDPRLSFPPKNTKIDYTSPESSPLSVFPSAALAQTEIWKDDVRNRLRKPQYKKKDIDQRKSNNLVPGTPLLAQRQDDRVPVVLIQRSVESTSAVSPSSEQHSSTSPSLHGWTLIIPSGWAMPFFSSLVYTGTRVGGQRERQTQAFEAGCAYFPRDYPSTEAYGRYMDDWAQEERDRWERKPPAKRTNFDKVGTKSPWQPDWEIVLGLEDALPAGENGCRDDMDLISAQRNSAAIASTSENTNKTKKKIQHWLLRGVDVQSIIGNISSMFNPGAGLLDCLDQMRIKRRQNPLNPSVKADELWTGALVSVRLTLCGRGCPQDLALIYTVVDEEAKKWYKSIAVRRQGTGLTEESPDETELSKLVPSQDSIIGYISTGHYSLSRGEGYAIGAISVAQLFELKQQAVRLAVGSSLLVKVRDREQTTCRAAHLEVMTG